jgi:hypothetical protein
VEHMYQPEQALQYEMTASNHGWKYEFHAQSVPTKDTDGGC